MTESQVVNEWISQGEAKGDLRRQRKDLLEILTLRFPGAATNEIVRLINEQDSVPLLEDWFRAAVLANAFEQFLAEVRK